nr:PRO2603 [Homo sapiens]
MNVSQCLAQNRHLINICLMISKLSIVGLMRSQHLLSISFVAHASSLQHLLDL